MSIPDIDFPTNAAIFGFKKAANNYVQTTPTPIFTAQATTASGVTFVGSGGTFTGSISVDKTIKGPFGQTLKMFCSTNGGTLVFSPPNPALTMREYGRIDICANFADQRLDLVSHVDFTETFKTVSTTHISRASHAAGRIVQ